MAQADIGRNLNRIRRESKLTQETLANRAGLSRNALRSIENGKALPRSENLLSIANALGVRVYDLVRSAPHLHSVRFRSFKRLRDREGIRVDVATWLRDFNEIEDLLGNRREYRLADLPVRIRRIAKDRPRRAAALVRDTLGIHPSEPIRDICGLLESSGIKVHAVSKQSDAFFGLSISAGDGGPAIIVNTHARMPVERWIFSAAHELGHLMLHLDSYREEETNEEEAEEKEANEFASNFLMPQSIFEKEWNESRGLSLCERVFKVKRMFSVSYRTVLYRLVSMGLANETVWRRFQSEHKKRFGKSLFKRDEPKGALPSEFSECIGSREPERLRPIDFQEDRLSGLVRMAIEANEITLARGAEILRKPLGEMRELAGSWLA